MKWWMGGGKTRTVYNFGLCAFGVSNMLWQIKNLILTDEIGDIEKPEYVIYVFINDHFRRIYTDKFGLEHQPYQIRMKDIPFTFKKKRLYMSLIDSRIGEQLLRFQFVKNITMKYIYNNYLIEKMNDENFNILKLYFEKSKKMLEQKYPNIKFIIIKYPSKIYNCDCLENLENSPLWKELENEGFIIIDLKRIVKEDLTQNKYLFSDGHPNEQAWDIVTKQVVKELKL